MALVMPNRRNAALSMLASGAAAAAGPAWQAFKRGDLKKAKKLFNGLRRVAQAARTPAPVLVEEMIMPQPKRNKKKGKNKVRSQVRPGKDGGVTVIHRRELVDTLTSNGTSETLRTFVLSDRKSVV